MMTLKDRISYRLEVVRLGFLCAIGAAAVAFGIAWLADIGLWPVALVAFGAWLYAGSSWFILMALIVGDLLVWAITRKTVVLPWINEIASRRETDRILTKQPEPKLPPIRNAILMSTFWTNPLIPFGIGTAAFLSDKPVMESTVASLVEETLRQPHAQYVRQHSPEWAGHTRMKAA